MKYSIGVFVVGLAMITAGASGFPLRPELWSLMAVPVNGASFLDVLMKFSPFNAKNWGFNPEKIEHYDDEKVISYITSKDSNFETWVQTQNEFAFRSILANIGGVGILDGNVANGAVIASPSKIRPNYFYQWTRDAAITVQSLVEYLDDHDFDEGPYKLILAIESYILNSYSLQRLDNKSGTWDSLDGLGEPKFMADSTTFDENWGRPQRDGPALRIITIVNYLKLLNRLGKDVAEPDLRSANWIYENIVKPDLMYTLSNWYKSGFDLWEEIDSLHLFTSLTQLKALKSGIEIAKLLGETDKEFLLSLSRAFQSLRFFIVVDSGYKIIDIPYLIETPSLLAQGRRSGLDIATLLATLRAHDMSAEDSHEIPFSVEDSAVFSTLVAIVTDMTYRYPLNHINIGSSKAVALGRYPEDVYDGYGMTEGNPWFIATATASEIIYRLIYHLYHSESDFKFTKDQSSVISRITSIEFSKGITQIVIPFKSDSYEQVAQSLFNYADSFLEVIKDHVDEKGHMSEQFNKYSGYMEGAENLTWSYGAFWSAIRWRNKVLKVMKEA